MVLQLIAVTPETQMLFGAAQMIVRATPDPVIIRMCSRALPGPLFPAPWRMVPCLSFSMEDQTLRSHLTRGIRGDILDSSGSAKAPMSSGV